MYNIYLISLISDHFLPWEAFTRQCFHGIHFEKIQQIFSEILCCSKIPSISCSQLSLAYGTAQWRREHLILNLHSLKSDPHFSQKSCEAPRCVACIVPSRQLDWIFVHIRQACWHGAERQSEDSWLPFPLATQQLQLMAELFFVLTGHVSNSTEEYRQGRKGWQIPFRI